MQSRSWSFRSSCSRAMWAVVFAASFSTACSAPAEKASPAEPEQRHPSYRRARIAVSDEVSGRLSIFDLEENDWIASIEMDGPRRLVASESGDFATLISKATEKVGFLRGGVSVAPHDDHLHIYKFPPSLHGFELSGPWRSAVVSNARQIGVFIDEIGQGRVIAEQELIPRDSMPIPTTYPTGDAHQGLVVPMSKGVFVTNPMSLDAIQGRANSVVYAHEAERIDIAIDCPSIEGSTGLGNHAAFACADGVVVASLLPDDNMVSGQKWAYPGTGRAQALQGHAPRGLVAGKLGADALFWLNVNTGATKRIDVGAEVCGYAVEPSTGESIVALTTDGALHVFDVETGESTLLADAVPPFVCNALQNESQLALTPDRIFVTVPSAGEVLEIGFEPFTIRKRHGIGGAPGAIVVLGLDAVNIDLAAGTH